MNVNTRFNFSDFIKKGREAIWNLNLFQSIPPTEDPTILRKQYFSTRLFILFFIICLSIFTIYTSQISIIERVTVKNPSYQLYKQLFLQYPYTLTCPCTTISIPQKEFIQLNASYHPVCSSIFVQDPWLNRLSELRSSRFVSIEFRYTGNAFFQMVASFCELSKQLIDDQLLTFVNTPFISAAVISPDLLSEQTEVSIDLLVSNMETDFMRLISLIRLSTNTDGLLSGLFTNFNFEILPYIGEWSQATPIPRTFEETNCTCFRGNSCNMPVYITSDGTSSGAILDYVPGLYVGCFNIDGFLQSSLQFIFDQNTIDHVLQLIFQTYLFNGVYPAVDRTTLQRFTVNTSGSELISHLFVDNWTHSSSHEHYFLFCQPIQCQYSFVGKNGFIVTITIVLGIIGGLNTILRLLVPVIIDIFFRIKRKLCHTNVNSSTVENSPPIQEGLEVQPPLRTRIRNTLITMKNIILHYNMFPSHTPPVHEHEIRIQKISTVLFLLFMSISFMILAVNTAMETMTTSITINQPNYTTYQTLSLQYPQTLSCLCSTISIKQGTFINVEPTFHPVCSSDFVSSKFLAYLLSDSTVSLPTAYNPFEFISSLCNLSNASITDSLAVFMDTRFISREVLTKDVFDRQIQEMIDTYIETIINSVILSFSFIRHTTTGNKLINGFSLNGIILVPSIPQNANAFYITSLYSDSCDCLVESCTDPALLVLPDGTEYSVPGFYTGCYIVDYILKSDLQCFYDGNCTELFLSVYHSPMDFDLPILDPDTTRYSIFSSINDLFEALFVENWTSIKSHDQYFNQCKPSSCSYIILTKNNLITIVTITIGFLGGILIVLRFIVPKMVHLLFRCCFIKRNNSLDPAHESSLILTWGNLKTILSKYNLFPTFPPTENEVIYQNQIIATRLLIIIFTIALISITFFNLLAPTSVTFVVNSPTYNKYLDLYNRYEENVECPCTEIAVPYSDFMEIDYSFHQICSSVYVGSIWPKIINEANRFSPLKYSSDFRTVGGSIFQVIGSFCELANSTINNELITFKSQELIGNNMIAQKIFSEQANTSFKLFVQTMESDFQRTSQLFRSITVNNVFASLTTSNFVLFQIYDGNSTVYMTSSYSSYINISTGVSNCDCGPPSTCTQEAAVLDAAHQTVYNISGIVVACYPVEAALKSTLSCFFNQTCVDELRAALEQSSIVFYELNTTALDDSLPSQYSSETQIEEMFNHLMTEDIISNASHEKYYETCRPSKCFYTIQSRKNPVYVLTVILGLIGGLSTVLHITIPHIVKIISNLFNRLCHCNRHRAQVHPT